MSSTLLITTLAATLASAPMNTKTTQYSLEISGQTSSGSTYSLKQTSQSTTTEPEIESSRSVFAPEIISIPSLAEILNILFAYEDQCAQNNTTTTISTQTPSGETAGESTQGEESSDDLSDDDKNTQDEDLFGEDTPENPEYLGELK